MGILLAVSHPEALFVEARLNESVTCCPWRAAGHNFRQILMDGTWRLRGKEESGEREMERVEKIVE